MIAVPESLVQRSTASNVFRCTHDLDSDEIGRIEQESSMIGQSVEIALQDALDFVAANPHVFLLARRADGYPTAYAMMARVVDGAVEFSTYRASAKVKNLLRDGVGGITSVAEDRDDPRVLVASGSIAAAEAPNWVDEVEGGSANAANLGDRPAVPSDISDKVRSRHDSGKRTVLRLEIDKARFSRKAGRL
jgi:hypothetical protein